ncbi:hypothetical protein MSP7336_03037 [Mycobacterium shimoidei]|uniref:Uncharacterized protein n=1 Tax=Mycobacterium shimoidei TaxID=29313 RepID=A0A375Z104_MYCSH|nr:hypothetical protein [Mycobacterium shimoidei]SRX94776.1 hypothetical protein MSP7336_03037 [Mycobacterium shimoidei]
MGKLFGWLIVIAMVIEVLRVIWPFLVIGVVAYLAIRGVAYLAEQHRKTLAARDAVQDAVRRRADRQHAQLLRGDPAGVYGEYPVPDLGEYNPTLWVCNQPLRPAVSRRSAAS